MLGVALHVQVGDNEVGFSGKSCLAVKSVEEQRSTKYFCFSEVALLSQIPTEGMENDISVLSPPQYPGSL